MVLPRFPSKIVHDGYAVFIGGPMAMGVATWHVGASRCLELAVVLDSHRKVYPNLTLVATFKLSRA